MERKRVSYLIYKLYTHIYIICYIDINRYNYQFVQSSLMHPHTHTYTHTHTQILLHTFTSNQFQTVPETHNFSNSSIKPNPLSKKQTKTSQRSSTLLSGTPCTYTHTHKSTHTRTHTHIHTATQRNIRSCTC